MRLLTSLSLFMLALALGCTAPPLDDDDAANDDDAVNDDDDDDDAADDDDDDDYPGLPVGLSPGVDWTEALDTAGAEVYSGILLDEFQPPTLPWDESGTQDLGDAGGALTLNTLVGNISSIVLDSWDGDTDAYKVHFPEGGFLHYVLDWDKEGGDYDGNIYCEYQDKSKDYGIYDLQLSPGAMDLSKPEAGITTLPIYDGTDCWFFVVGYSGSEVDYTLQLVTDGQSLGSAPWPPQGDDDDSAAE
jgi:hypothetical protein